jgi:S1-C subfamily serine protease
MVLSQPNQATTSQNMTALFKKFQNSVVQITSQVTTVNSNIIINGMPMQNQETILGSGFVYDSSGHIITNNHVVGSSKMVTVTFIDGDSYKARVVGTDPYSDMAVIQLGNATDENLVPIPFGNSSESQVGQQVIAIGNPYGLSDTLTTGVVSQTGRILPNTEFGYSIPDVIQTDAAINPGNSGGPLLNTQGQVIGMNTAIKTNTGQFAGIGFAISSNEISRIAPHLITQGNYSHPWLGIDGASINPDFAQLHGLSPNYHGVIIENVVKGGAADLAGVIAPNSTASNLPSGIDIIIAADSNPVKSIDEIISYLEEHKRVGDKITLTVNRDGKILDLSAVLQARPSPL